MNRADLGGRTHREPGFSERRRGHGAADHLRVSLVRLVPSSMTEHGLPSHGYHIMKTVVHRLTRTTVPLLRVMIRSTNLTVAIAKSGKAPLLPSDLP